MRSSTSTRWRSIRSAPAPSRRYRCTPSPLICTQRGRPGGRPRSLCRARRPLDRHQPRPAGVVRGAAPPPVAAHTDRGGQRPLLLPPGIGQHRVSASGSHRPLRSDAVGRGDFFILPAASDPTHRADEEGACSTASPMHRCSRTSGSCGATALHPHPVRRSDGPGPPGRGGARPEGRGPQPGQRPARHHRHPADPHRHPHPVGHAGPSCPPVGSTPPPSPERGPRSDHRLPTRLLFADRRRPRRRRRHHRSVRVGLGACRRIRHPTRPLSQPSQRIGPSGLFGPDPGCRTPHLPPVPRHPIRSAHRLSHRALRQRTVGAPGRIPGHRRGGRGGVRGDRRPSRPHRGAGHSSPRRGVGGHRRRRGHPAAVRWS